MRNSLWPPAGAGLMAVLVVASACREGRSSPSPGDNPTIASVDLSPHSDSVEVHRSRPLKVVLRDPQGLVVAPCYPTDVGRVTRVKVSSSDSGLAGVLPIGCMAEDTYRAMVIGRSIGIVTITAVATEKKDSSTINVNQAPSRFTSASPSGTRTCGLYSNGLGYCWGAEIGYAPMRISDLPFQVITGGCGIVQGGLAYCWGENLAGEVGVGDFEYREAPVPVLGGRKYLGIWRSSGVTCALDLAGQAFCWGDNSVGALGNPVAGPCPANEVLRACSTEPVAVSGGLSFTALTVSNDHVCGIVPSGGAYCWGDNSYGQLGSPAPHSTNTPTKVSGGVFLPLHRGCVQLHVWCVGRPPRILLGMESPGHTRHGRWR